MEHIINPLWGHVLFGKDVGTKVTGVHRVIGEGILQKEAASEELVGVMCGLGVVVPCHYHRVLTTGLVHKLVDLVDLAVPLSGVQLDVYNVYGV